MNYEFVNSTAFLSPQKYDYADCESPEFLFAWKNSRLELSEKLNYISAKRQEQFVPQFEEAFTLQNLLNDVKPEDEHGSRIVWSLIKKFEVFGRLYSHYDSDLFRHEDANPATISDYVSFGETLVLFAEKGENLQYLSTLLKLNDSFCGLDSEEFDQKNAKKLMLILESERRLVERLL